MTVDSGRDVPAEAAPLPRISVALGTYNGERFLGQQLESLARQRVLPTELVACDDCSADRTMAILEDFARIAPFPVRIFRNDSNLGFTANFIGAADRCQGPLVAFCDQDDVWLESKIEACATFFADHPGVRLLLHAAQPVDERLRPVGNAYPPVSSRGVVPALGADPWQVAPGCMIVFDKAVLDLADWRERPLSRDLNGCPMDFDEWLYFLAWSIGEVGFIADRLIQYRQHGKNLFGAPTPGWLVRLRKLLNEDFATHAGRATVARSYAAFLERNSQALAPEDADVQEQLAAGARFWRAYEQLSRQRDAFYDAESFRERLRRLRKLVVSGAYGGRETGRLGRLALARDLRELVWPGRGVDSATNAVGSA
jgi:glycosyltransferase involved in cell wall biosynthesis